MSLFNELKRRNVFRVGIAYAIASWLLLQMSDILVPLLGLPESAQKLILLLLVIGFIPALIFAWAFEMTPDGIKKEKDVDRQSSVTPKTGFKLNIAIISMLVFGMVYFAWESRFATDQTNEATEVAEDSPVQPTPAVIDISVAVLPFVNMSSDPEQEYFSDGLSEELLNRLAQNDQLRVAARTSAFQFKGQNIDISDIGRKLNVANVLEGSVRKSGNRLRITAQLIQVDNGFHLWSQTYEREIDDVFAIQDDIAVAISSALETELGAIPMATDVAPTQNIEAYQAYLQARYLLAKRGETNMLKAHELFEQAVSLDPTFSNAWSGLAYNYGLLPNYGLNISRPQAWEIVKMAANKAIELDPANAEAYAAHSWSNIQDDFKTILKTFEKAYELAPNNADVINFYADFMSKIGDFATAEQLQNRTIELDPLAAVHYSDMASTVMFPQGRFKEGLEYGRKANSLQPDSIYRADPFVTGLITNGLFDEAIEVIKRFEGTTNPDVFTINFWWCFLYYYQGNEQVLREKLAEINRQLANGQAVFDYSNLAFFTMTLDGANAALPMLARAKQRDEHNLIWPGYFFLPEELSDDPDWLAFWQQPKLNELIEIRRSFKTQKHSGIWKK